MSSDWFDDFIAGLTDLSGTWRLMISLRYEGPFERIGMWLLAIDPVTNELRRDVPGGSLRDWFADIAERLDQVWRGWYVRHRRYPPDRWRRRMRSGPDLDEYRENPVNPWSGYGRDESW